MNSHNEIELFYPFWFCVIDGRKTVTGGLQDTKNFDPVSDTYWATKIRRNDFIIKD